MNKTFTFYVEDEVEAETLEAARREFQERLDNGNLTLDHVGEWLVRQSPEPELNKHEINQEIVFSTAHVSYECKRAMENSVENANHIDEKISLTQLSIYDTEYGFRVHAAGAGELPPTGFPELDKLLAFAQKHNCKWLTLDCDGPESKDFETFDW